MPADSPAPPLTGRPWCAEADARDAAERPRAVRAPASGIRRVRHRSDRGIAIRTPRDHRRAPPERPGHKRPPQRRNARQRQVPAPAEPRGRRKPRRPPPPPGGVRPASSRCCGARASGERAARLRRQPTAGPSPLCAGQDELWRVRLFFVGGRGGPGGPGGLRATCDGGVRRAMGRLADRWCYPVSAALGVVPLVLARFVEVPVRIEVAAWLAAPSASAFTCIPMSRGVGIPRNEQVESKKTEVAHAEAAQGRFLGSSRRPGPCLRQEPAAPRRADRRMCAGGSAAQRYAEPRRGCTKSAPRPLEDKVSDVAGRALRQLRDPDRGRTAGVHPGGTVRALKSTPYRIGVRSP